MDRAYSPWMLGGWGTWGCAPGWYGTGLQPLKGRCRDGIVAHHLGLKVKSTVAGVWGAMVTCCCWVPRVSCQTAMV